MGNRRLITGFLWILTFWGFFHGGLFPLQADVIYLQDGSTWFGRVVSQNASSVTFQRRNPATSTYRELTIARDRVAALVINIQPKQLERLEPAQPQDYLEMAEELAPQSKDPEARDLAIRLYLLAAVNGPNNLRDLCVRALIPLARTVAEEKRFRALANIYLGDAQAWLVPSRPPSQASPTIPAEISDRRQKLRAALVELRSGKRADAADVINQSWVEQTLQPFDNICSWRELRKWSIAPELATEWLARTIELEIAIDESLETASPKRDATADWSILAEQTVSPLQPISFRNATEFDLSKNVFRNGQWTQPDRP